ncbi:MAG: glutamine--scyllo-inositol aminotransferase [marine bacterium B5-7]|nr:MAG: glutamine--scyllo-inositol aminotransferase [marine bacterium B5-7]
MKFLDLQRQYSFIKEEIDTAIRCVISDSAYIGGKYVAEFEGRFSEYLSVDHCVGVGNGTDALEIAIEVLGLKPGSEIIVPANSFAATAEAVVRTGMKLVFCDCDPKDYTICIDDLEKRITPQTSAIIPVHLYGHPCDMGKLLSIAKDNSLRIIEDCAQAHGACHGNRKVGSIGDIGVFSFYPGKNLGAYGDAGALVTNDDHIADRCRMISNHGRVSKHTHQIVGRNSRLDGLQAAVLSVKLTYLDGWLDHRRTLANQYRMALNDHADIQTPSEAPDIEHAYHLFVVRASERDILQESLNKAGIQTGIHYPVALPNQPAFSGGHDYAEHFVATNLAKEILSLPIGEHLDVSDIDFVCEKVTNYYKNTD